MTTTIALTVLVVGATGSIGSLVVDEAFAVGYLTRALVRDPVQGGSAPTVADRFVVGDVTRPDSLRAAVDGIDAVVITLGSDGSGAVGPRPSTTPASVMCWPPSATAQSGSR